jgi:hypothetical protein
MTIFIALGLAVLASITTISSVQAAQAARVQFTNGDVQIIGSDNVARAAFKGAVLNEGDTIVTGKNSAAQLRMADDGVVAMRPDSRIAIVTFQWEGKEDGFERSVLSLVKGGFRAITGVIGRRNKSNYLVNTPTATIGIRGTDHEPFYVPPPAPGETPPAPPGTYNKVNVGETVIRTPGGSVVIGANQIGFAPPQPNAPPVRLDKVPEFMRGAPIPQGRPDNRVMRENAAADTRRDGDGKGDIRGTSPNQQQPPQQPAYPIRTAGGDFDLGSQIANLQAAPVGAAATGGSVVQYAGQPNVGSGAIYVDGLPGNFILLNGVGNPVLVSNTSGFRFSTGLAPLVDSGGATIDGVPVKWGVYAGGVQFDPSHGAANAQFFQFMGAQNITPVATLQQTGAASFSTTVGFTKPVDEQGRVGGTASLIVGITFGANPTLTRYDLTVTDAGARNWTGTMSGSQLLSSFAKSQSSPNLNVSCGGACLSTGTGNASGFVIGPNRGGMISSYSLNAGTAGVTGSIAVK